MAIVRGTLRITEGLPGAPFYLGTITATTSLSKNNSSTAVPFGAVSSRTLLVCSDVDCALVFGESSTVAATATTGVLLYSGERLVITTNSSAAYLAVISLDRPAAASVNLAVFELR